ncbi:MAG: N-acyl homoserine lactonase family protein [Solirubrobacteraceae bacterium]|nr:N-acyl homoserine lactonase family protein [Solirubrobacteraceae bacterium]
MPDSSVTRVIPLILGWERLPISFSLHGDTTGEVIVEPVPALLLDTDDGWTLIDVGINSVIVRDPWLFQRLHGRNHMITPYLPAEHDETLIEQLRGHGVELSDVTRIFLSHLHNDHAGCLRLFDAKVPVWVQQREYDYAMTHPHPEQHGMFRIDYDDPQIEWHFMDGDEQLAPGIFAFTTPGHTPGHQSFVIETKDGQGWVFAYDAGDLTANFEQEISPGGLIKSTPEEGLTSVLRVKEIATQRGFPVIPGHDPIVWPKLIRAAGGVPPEFPGDA